MFLFGLCPCDGQEPSVSEQRAGVKSGLLQLTLPRYHSSEGMMNSLAELGANWPSQDQTQTHSFGVVMITLNLECS